MWNTIKGVTVESLGDNRFIFYFHSNIDKKRILRAGPWHFNNSLIALVEPQGAGDISKIHFTKTLFWVQIHNSPIVCMNKETWLALGKLIGEVEEVDSGQTGECFDRFIRVRVHINITQPLQRVLVGKLFVDEEDVIMLPLLYERLPKFCYYSAWLVMLTRIARLCPTMQKKKILAMARG